VMFAAYAAGKIVLGPKVVSFLILDLIHTFCVLWAPPPERG
jgi:hypothetical protein